MQLKADCSVRRMQAVKCEAALWRLRDSYSRSSDRWKNHFILSSTQSGCKHKIKRQLKGPAGFWVTVVWTYRASCAFIWNLWKQTTSKPVFMLQRLSAPVHLYSHWCILPVGVWLPVFSPGLLCSPFDWLHSPCFPRYHIVVFGLRWLQRSRDRD